MKTKRSITIGINILFLIPNKVGGTEYYTRLLLQHLHDAPQESEYQYIVYTNKESAATFHFPKENWKLVVCPIYAHNRFFRLLYEFTCLPFLVKLQGCSLLHSFGYTSPFLLGVKSLATVHDANWKDHPEDTPLLTQLITATLMNISLAASTRILTDSQFSLQRLAAHFPKSEEKLEVLRPILNPAFFRPEKDQKQKARSQKTRYILCVSALYPHKRIDYLLDLWDVLQKTLSDVSLILIGQNGKHEDMVRERLRTAKRIRYYKKVPFPQLVELYQNAELFLFPSIYEGFGYPVYEAAASHLPVLLGNAQCYEKGRVQESCQLSFDLTEDVRKVHEALQNPNKYRGRLSASQERRFTKRTLQQLKDIYREMAEG